MYKNYLLALLSGLLLALAWPTYGYSLLIFIALVPLLLAEINIRLSGTKRNNLHTFFAAYFGFLLWNTITTWWIWNSTPIGGIFALVVNSLLMTLVFQIYHLIAKRKPQRFALIFLISLWISFEKFHLIWDFSWPWLNLGNVFSENTKWIQWYEYTGVFGGTLWIWVVNVFVFYAVVYFLKTNDLKQSFKKLLVPISFVILGIFISLYSYYSYEEKGKSFTAIALQPNTNPYTEKYHQPSVKIARNLISLAEQEIDSSVSFVLAPETVLSEHMTLERFVKSKANKEIENFTAKYQNATFLGGINLYRKFISKEMPTPTANKFTRSKNAWYESYNAAIFIKNEQKPEVYHKSRLVVGVENVPYRAILAPLLGDIMIAQGSSPNVLTTQKEAEVFTNTVNGIKAAPVICYESIYGEYVSQYTRKGANFLAIITNDSWWGDTQGHKQLLSYARLRAIENRRAIARSANSGISAFINQRGDVLSRLEYETKGALKGTLKANTKVTFYTQFGDYIARIATFVAGLFFLIGFFVKKK